MDLGNIIGGAIKGVADPNYPAQFREQQFQHHENAMRLAQMRQTDLAKAVQEASDRYAGPEGERLRDLQMQIHTLDPGSSSHAQDIAKLTQQYVQHKQYAQKVLADQAAKDATTIKPVAPVPPPSAQNSSPFSSMIGQSPVPGKSNFRDPGPVIQDQYGFRQRPDAAPAAQPATNPLTSPQGGGPQANAPFQPPASQPVAAAANSAPVASAAPIQPVANPLNFQPSFDAFNNTGYIDPVTATMIPGQAGLYTAQQKLQMIEPYIQQMPQQLQGIVRAEVLSGGNGLTGIMGTMFAAPQKHFVDAGGMSPEEKQAAGIPPDAAGKYTIYWDRFHNVVGTEPGWAGSMTTSNAQGVQGKESVNDILKNGGAATAVGGGPSVNSAFVPTQRTSVQHIPGQEDQTTTSRSQKGSGNSGGIPPVSRASGSGTGGGGGDPIVKRKYEDWAAGGPAPAGKELTAVQDYAQKNNLPSPTPLSAAGTKAMAAVDPVLEEIKRTKEMFKAAMDKGLTQQQLAKDWALYQIHQDSPNTKLISNLSFSSLRSAVSALAGSSSRAYPVLKMALEHTPSALGSPKRSMELLEEMEVRVNEARKFILEDEKKSGIISPVKQGAGPIPSVAPGAPRDPLGVR